MENISGVIRHSPPVKTYQRRYGNTTAVTDNVHKPFVNSDLTTYHLNLDDLIGYNQTVEFKAESLKTCREISSDESRYALFAECDVISEYSNSHHNIPQYQEAETELQKKSQQILEHELCYNNDTNKQHLKSKVTTLNYCIDQDPPPFLGMQSQFEKSNELISYSKITDNDKTCKYLDNDVNSILKSSSSSSYQRNIWARNKPQKTYQRTQSKITHINCLNQQSGENNTKLLHLNVARDLQILKNEHKQPIGTDNLSLLSAIEKKISNKDDSSNDKDASTGEDSGNKVENIKREILCDEDDIDSLHENSVEYVIKEELVFDAEKLHKPVQKFLVVPVSGDNKRKNSNTKTVKGGNFKTLKKSKRNRQTLICKCQLPDSCNICNEMFLFGCYKSQNADLESSPRSKLQKDHHRVQVIEDDCVTPPIFHVSYSCYICNQHFISINSLQSHMQMHNDNKALYTCKVCLNTYATLSPYWDHIKIHEKKKKIYVCYFCDQHFEAQNLYWMHICQKRPSKSKKRKNRKRS